ncbi:hypothetical protein LPJ66_010195 [Kickxella alabastrina]|uniref:Uncharacterized protein n=1 Tax=Kickxella alabastrina TaxID=61397 RepID=A0ACC1I3D5_9FUNG|nr:hypothetical protein LPJ66_010195 [Kickxella alabastrina]
MSSQVTRTITPRSRAANTLAKLEDALSNPPCLSCSHLEIKYKAVDSMLGRKIIEVMEKDLEIRHITAEAQKMKVALDVCYNDYINATRTSLESVNTDFSIAQDRIHELEQINGEHMALIDDAKTRISEFQKVYNDLDAARREMDELHKHAEQAEATANNANAEKEALCKELNKVHYWNHALCEQFATATITANFASAEKEILHELLAAVTSTIPNGTNAEKEALCELLATATTSISNGSSAEMRALRMQLHGAISTASAAFDERDNLQKKLATSWAEKDWFMEQLKAATACSDHLRKLLYEATHTHAAEPNSAYLRHELAKSDKNIDQQ